MDRNLRRMGRGRAIPFCDSDANVRVYRHKKDQFEEMLPLRRFPLEIDTARVLPRVEMQPTTAAGRRVMMTSRACSAFPELEDFGQLTSVILPDTNTGPGNDQYQNLLLEQYGFNPIDPSTTIDQLKALKQALCNSLSPKVENSSQYANPDRTFADMIDETPFVLDTVDDIDQFLNKEKEGRSQRKKDTTETETPSSTNNPFTNYTSKDVHISETPRVKVIAEKYTRFKKNNIELRKLEEKIVCIEYDVYDQEIGFFKYPVQVMRAFFSITTSCEKCEGGGQILSEIPPAIKNTFQINEEEIKKLSKKEIEMIDEKITENKPYLDDLRRILKKQRAIKVKKKKSTLDLLSMYDMARRECPPLDHDFSNTNLLSKAELQEIKDLILEKCESGAIGISRRTVRNPKSATTDATMKSDSAFFDILRDCASFQIPSDWSHSAICYSQRALNALDSLAEAIGDQASDSQELLAAEDSRMYSIAQATAESSIPVRDTLLNSIK